MNYETSLDFARSLDEQDPLKDFRHKFHIPKKDGKYDLTRLLEELKKVKELYPEKMDVVITMEDELKYEHLITGMDALLEAEFPEIAIATAGAQ